jgi:hypothetical protein
MSGKRPRNVAARIPTGVLQAPVISVRMPQAVAMTGLSRTRLYQMIKDGELTIAKDGNSTLILVDSLREAIAKRILAR